MKFTDLGVPTEHTRAPTTYETDYWRWKAQKAADRQQRIERREQTRAAADATSFVEIGSMYVKPINRTFKRLLYRFAPKNSES